MLRFTQCSGLGKGGANRAQRRGIRQLPMKERTKAWRDKRHSRMEELDKETELEIAETEKDTIGGEQGR